MMTLKRPRPSPASEPEGLVGRLDAELRQRVTREQGMARAAHDQTQAAAAAKAARAEEHYRRLGLDVSGIAAFHRMLAGEDASARGALRHAALAFAPASGTAPHEDEQAPDAAHPYVRRVRLASSHVRRRAAAARGSGTGWFGSGTQVATETDFWHFAWTPPTTARYTFWPEVAFRGMFITQAADDFWTSNRAEVGLDFHLHYWQGSWKDTRGPDLLAGGGNVFTRGGTDVNECVGMDWVHRPTGAGIHPVALVAGEPALVSVQLTLRALARGEGSYAEVSSAGDGSLLACRGLLGTYTPGD
jgi:hypothetical protein